MSTLIFLDTCIVIDFINGKLDLNKETLDNSCINSIVDMEVVVGTKNKRELHTINKKLNSFKKVKIDQDILTLARELLAKYALSHNMSIYDAIIASTCLIYDLPLWTYNKKDFRYIEDLVLIEF